MLQFNKDNTLVSRPDALDIGPKLLCHRVFHKDDKSQQLIKVLRSLLKKKQKKSRGVLFSPYKSEKYRGSLLEWSVANIAKTIVPKLKLQDNEIASYTGNTNTEERQRILEDLHKRKGKIRLLLATSAFGFGVDIGNFDFSIHVQVPEDLDRFYQEISRCSREPMKGIAHVFYSPHEVAAATKRNMGTFRYETVREYLEYLKISKIKKKARILNLRNVLKKSDKEYTGQHRAQMAADAYFQHAFEAVMFLYRHDILELRPFTQKHFPNKMNQLCAAFENGRPSGYGKVPFKGYKVRLPAVKLPVRIIKNVSWPMIKKLVTADKSSRGKRTERFKIMGRNTTCHWRILAQQYDVPLRSHKQNDHLVEKCGYCSVCKA